MGAVTRKHRSRHLRISSDATSEHAASKGGAPKPGQKSIIQRGRSLTPATGPLRGFACRQNLTTAGKLPPVQHAGTLFPNEIFLTRGSSVIIYLGGD